MMKRLVAIALLLAANTYAATLTPIQLLNPTGSTAGQAIVSTGPTGTPIWGSSGLAAINANSLLGNSSGSSAVPSAVAVPSCSATGSALVWTSNTGFGCATGYAPLASPTFTGTVTTSALTSTGAFTPNQTAGIIGTTTNNNANTGSVGEYVTNSTAGTTLSTGAVSNVTSASLAAGDWDVSCTVSLIPAAGTTTSIVTAGISTVNATLPAANTGGYVTFFGNAPGGSGFIVATPTVRESLSITTTVYCLGAATFATSTMTANGFIRARRIR